MRAGCACLLHAAPCCLFPSPPPAVPPDPAVPRPRPCPARLPQSALGPELLVALEARGTVFLPASPTAVEGYVRKTIAAEQTEDNFFV